MTSFGDVLEWVAGACLVTAAYLAAGDAAAFATAGGFLAWEAQVLAGFNLPKFRKQENKET